MANSLVYGIHAVQAIIEKHPDQLVELLLLSGSQSNVRLQKLAQSARSRVKVREVTRLELDSLTDGATHQGVAAYFRGAEPRGGRCHHRSDQQGQIACHQRPPDADRRRRQ